ncbi:cellulose binding domain-containing protein [Micromonosporaceae bacterium B7E4]
MATLTRRGACAVALAAALTLGVAAAVVLLPARTQAATSAFQKESEWPTGYLGKMTVRNDTAATMTGWRVEFELPAGTGSPQVCLVNDVACAGGDDDDGRPDVSPPVIPANPRTAFTGQTLTLLWDASSDDRGVTGYELFSNGRRFATTTGTSHTMPVPPPMLFTFGIRAVDAAGNSSPFAIIKLGSLPDSDPPTAPGNLRLTGPHDGHYRITWDASRDNVFVAGYRVQQTGTVSRVTLVGDTFGYGVSRGYGSYLFEVRAFDSSGNFSAPAHIGIAVDPPPPTPMP